MEALTDPLKKTMAQYGFVLWLALTAVTVLGFRFLSPNERIAKVEVRIEALQQKEQADSDVRATMIRWMCVKSTPREISLSGLKCAP